jgi:hypothetical protein
MIGERKTPKVINGKQIIFIQIYKDIAHNNVEEKVGQLLSHLVLTFYKQYKYGQFCCI